MQKNNPDSFKAKDTLTVGAQDYTIFSLPKAAAKLGDISRFPFCQKILLENLLRHQDGDYLTAEQIGRVVEEIRSHTEDSDIAFRPARVLMQDFTGVPAVVDLAAMRDATVKAGGDAQKVNPLSPVDLVIDHSVMVDAYASDKAFDLNVKLEMQRNRERYEFL
ncbi:MAG: aconitate hydratase, partial [Gammaproteobacteria bacterium]|nr:aconitate hydratase [Gammaproteobacteria bacterium]